MAPKYQPADNPNMLAGWYKNWRDVPDGPLKWDHLETLPLGVNFKIASMQGAWNDLFGPIVDAYGRGVKLSSYADLPRARRSRAGKPRPLDLDLKEKEKEKEDLDLKDTVRQTVTQTVSKPLNVFDFNQQSRNRTKAPMRSSPTPVPGSVAKVDVSSPAQNHQEESKDGAQDAGTPKVNRTKGGNILPPGWE
jgi:hypothetical protein